MTVTLPLPDIMSMSKEEIEKWAQDNFMAKVRITGEFNDSVPLGKVIKFEINDATVVDKVSRNTPIYVIVSKGVEDQAAITVTIPNFKEKSLAECYTFANENGLVLTVEEQYDDYVPKGTIISQSVKAQEKVKKGTAVVLAVSKGKMITIPSFSGYTKEKATAYAAQLQIPITITEKYSGSAAGVLISQSIKAGTVYEEGNIVELKYSLGNKIALTSYVGQTRDAIESWAKDLNDKGASITIKVTNSISNAAKGTVIYQDQANALISTKTTINITVSLGKTVFMPDFVIESQDYAAAITREEALTMCEELKLIPTFVAEENANVLPGTVWYQNKEPGTEITEGTSITLKYRQSKQGPVPDFVGNKMSENDAKKYSNQLTITIVYADQHVEGFDNQVCEQSLTAGSTVASGSAITLKISLKETP